MLREERLVIDTLFIAPKACAEAEAAAFARHHHLGLELETFLHPKSLIHRQDTLARLQEDLAHFAGPLSLHGPVMDLNPASLDPGITAQSRERYKQAIDVALTLGARYLAFHSQWTPIYTVANCYQPWKDEMVQYFRQLVDEYVKDTPLTLVVENFLDQDPSILQDFVDGVDSPYFRACLDIGHVNLFSRLDPVLWYDALQGRIATIHLHNNNGRLDQHNALAEGSVPVELFLRRVAQSPHRVSLVVEVLTLQQVENSLTLIQPVVETYRPKVLANSFLI